MAERDIWFVLAQLSATQEQVTDLERDNLELKQAVETCEKNIRTLTARMNKAAAIVQKLIAKKIEYE